MMQKLFEKFEIVEVLKKDDHSTVYLANHIYLGKKIILKTLDTDKITDTTILSRFKREAKILAKLDHPNIIKVLDFGTYQNHFYLSFEYFDSRNLREHLNNGEFSDTEKKSLFIQLLKGLNAAHSANIIHRDIKPENILVNKSLKLKIADFGLAIEEDENLLTNKSSIVGTPAYMSPDQIKGEKLTPQSDIFSLGIVVHELFSGKNPFLGKDINETINHILSYKEEKIFEQIQHIDDKILRCIQNMLKKDSDKRPESINELFKELDISDSSELQKDTKSKIKSKLFIYPLFSVIVIITLILIVFLNKKDVLFESLENKKDLSITSKSDKVESNQKINTIAENKVQKNNRLKDEIKEDKIVRENNEIHNNISHEPAKLSIQCLPWADIMLDSNEIKNSNGYFSLEPGIHKIELLNPGYPKYSTEIKLESGEIKSFKIHLDTLFGYFDCKVFPWGEVFIDGQHAGQTPFLKPVILNPGDHSLSVHNPEYETVNKSFVIVKKETLHFEINLSQKN